MKLLPIFLKYTLLAIILQLFTYGVYIVGIYNGLLNGRWYLYFYEPISYVFIHWFSYGGGRLKAACFLWIPLTGTLVYGMFIGLVATIIKYKRETGQSNIH